MKNKIFWVNTGIALLFWVGAVVPAVFISFAPLKIIWMAVLLLMGCAITAYRTRETLFFPLCITAANTIMATAAIISALTDLSRLSERLISSEYSSLQQLGGMFLSGMLWVVIMVGVVGVIAAVALCFGISTGISALLVYLCNKKFPHDAETA